MTSGLRSGRIGIELKRIPCCPYRKRDPIADSTVHPSQRRVQCQQVEKQSHVGGSSTAVVDARRLGGLESKTGHGCRHWRACGIFGRDRCLGQASKSVEPDAEGRFRIDDLSPGAYRARLLLWNDRKWKEAANVAVRVEPGATTALRLGAPK